jgi:hypothetical protein
MFSIIKRYCENHKIKGITFIDANHKYTFIKPDHIDSLENENIVSFKHFNGTLFVYCETEFDRSGLTVKEKENFVPEIC